MEPIQRQYTGKALAGSTQLSELDSKLQSINAMRETTRSDVSGYVGKASNVGGIVAKVSGKAASEELAQIPLKELADLLSLTSEGMRALKIHQQIQELEQQGNPDRKQLAALEEQRAEALREAGIATAADVPQMVKEALDLVALLTPSTGAESAAGILGPIASGATVLTGLNSVRESVQALRAIQNEVDALEGEIADLWLRDGNEALLDYLDVALYFKKNRKVNQEMVKLIKAVMKTAGGGAGVAGKTAMLLGAKSTAAAAAAGPIPAIVGAGTALIATGVVVDQERANIAAAARNLPNRVRLFKLKREAAEVRQQAAEVVALYEMVSSAEAEPTLRLALRPSMKRLEAAAEALNPADQATQRAFNAAKAEHDRRVQVVMGVEEAVASGLSKALRSAGERMTALETKAQKLVEEMEAVEAQAAQETQAHVVGTSPGELDEWKRSLAELLDDEPTRAAFETSMDRAGLAEEFAADPVEALAKRAFS